MEKGKQLESFLLKCLSVDVSDRASSVNELKASGWISGGDKTQFARTSLGKMDKMNSKLDDLKEDVEELRLKKGDRLEPSPACPCILAFDSCRPGPGEALTVRTAEESKAREPAAAAAPPAAPEDAERVLGVRRAKGSRAGPPVNGR